MKKTIIMFFIILILISTVLAINNSQDDEQVFSCWKECIDVKKDDFKSCNDEYKEKRSDIRDDYIDCLSDIIFNIEDRRKAVEKFFGCRGDYRNDIKEARDDKIECRQKATESFDKCKDSCVETVEEESCGNGICEQGEADSEYCPGCAAGTCPPCSIGKGTCSQDCE